MDKYYTNEYDEEAFKLKHFLEQHASIAHMGEIVMSSNAKPIIGTVALDTCFGIVFYDRKNKKGIVGHAAPSGKTATMQAMLNSLEKGNQQVIEYAIVSGYRNEERRDYSGVEELIEYLRKKCPPNIKLIPFDSLNVQINYSTLTYEFAFDVNTGSNFANYLFYDGKDSLNKYR